MKAILLAAGKGERLGDVVRRIPKPMIPYKGKPILQHNIELCRRHGIKQIYMNTHYLAGEIRNYFGTGERFGVHLHYSYETQLLGTSGALNSFREELGKGTFFVLYGDNFSKFNLQRLRDAMKKRNCIGVIAFHYREDVSQSGVGEFDRDGRVTGFIEKPSPGTTSSHWVNAGIYLLNPAILKYIPEGFSDFGRDIFPLLLRENVPLYGVRSRVSLKAFDTLELLKAAQADDHQSAAGGDRSFAKRTSGRR